MKSENITGGLDLLGDWLDAKGFTEEAGLCTRAMDEINRLRDALNAAAALKETKHYSDCAVHNEPALPKGECDCGGYVDLKETE